MWRVQLRVSENPYRRVLHPSLFVVATFLASPWSLADDSGDPASPGARYDEIRGEVHEAGLAVKVNALEDLLFEIDQIIPDTGAHEETACWLLLKGTVLAELGREDDARALFDFLADACPIWEALNNLAILEAADGEFALAREHLEQAIEAAERSGEEHEVEIARGNLRSLSDEQPFMNLVGFAQECSAKDGHKASCSNAQASPEEQTEARAEAQLTPHAETSEIGLVPPELLPEPEATLAEPDVSDAPPPPPEIAAVLDAVERWRQSWELRRPDDFFSFYAPDCIHDGGVSHTQWREKKRSRIVDKAVIEVTISPPTRGIAARPGDIAIVFHQFYRSVSKDGTLYCDEGPKQLTFRRFAAGWRIVKETMTWNEVPCP